ncbi:hypothetical protein F2Q69_00018152, partial [Brassica cretica]
FNVETVEYKNISFTVWDVGGQDKVSSNLIMFQVLFDSLFRNGLLIRFSVGELLFSFLLWQDELRDAVLLVFANKQDLPNAMNAAEITDKLGLHSLRQRHW